MQVPSDWGHKKTALTYDRISGGHHREGAHVQMLDIERESEGGSPTDVFGEVSDQ
jgi:hypothetical protein